MIIRRFWMGAMALWLAFSLTHQPVFSFVAYNGGDGSEADPWQIATKEQLLYFMNDTAMETVDDYYRLMADIDLSGEAWTPVRHNSLPFAGSFDGNGFTIDHLSITMSDGSDNLRVGMFGQCEDCSITNLNLTNTDYKINVIGTAMEDLEVGGLVGDLFANRQITITNNTITGSITVNYTFDPSAEEQNIHVGGLLGGVRSGFLGDQSTISGNTVGVDLDVDLELETVFAEDVAVRVGGLAGVMGDQSLTNNAVTASSITVDWPVDLNVAELAKINQSTGGLVGFYDHWDPYYDYDQRPLVERNSVGSAEHPLLISGNQHVGGLIGQANSYHYATAQFNTVTNTTLIGNNHLGGLIGRSEGFDLLDNTVRLVTIQPHASFDFRTPHTIGGLAGFVKMDEYVFDNTVDGLTVVEAFKTRDAHTIGGAVGYADDEVSIVNTNVLNSTLFGRYNVGGLVGYARTLSISLSSVEHTQLVAITSVGGLVGYSSGNLSVSNALANIDITGDQQVGGILGVAGEIYVDISLTYVLGDISGTSQVGGMIGYAVSIDKITNSFVRADLHLIVVENDGISSGPFGISPSLGGILGHSIGMSDSTYTSVYYAGTMDLNGVSDEFADPIVGVMEGVDPSGTTSDARFVNVYFDSTLYPTTSLFGVGLDTVAMKQQPAYVGYDFEDVWVISPFINEGYAFFTGDFALITLVSPTGTTGFLVEPGDQLNEPEIPLNEGYVFEGWFTDEAMQLAFDFNTAIADDLTLYAKWTQSLPVTGEATNRAVGLFSLGLGLWLLSRKRRQ